MERETGFHTPQHLVLSSYDFSLYIVVFLAWSQISHISETLVGKSRYAVAGVGNTFFQSKTHPGRVYCFVYFIIKITSASACRFSPFPSYFPRLLLVNEILPPGALPLGNEQPAEAKSFTLYNEKIQAWFCSKYYNRKTLNKASKNGIKNKYLG